MSAKRRKGHPASPQSGAIDQTLERAIDAMSALRDELRKRGLKTPTDLLDQAVIGCLQLFVESDELAGQGEKPKGNGSTNGANN